jgi:hypothetical protein
VAEIATPRRGHHTGPAVSTPIDDRLLALMAAQIRELDEAATVAAERIAALSEDEPDRAGEAGSRTRLDLIADLATALVERTAEIRADCSRLSALIDRTARLVAGQRQVSALDQISRDRDSGVER